MKRRHGVLWLLLVVGLPCAPASAQQRQQLRSGWLIQSSAQAGTDGARISSSAYTPRGWIAATVPATVVGAQVQAGIFKDPFFGMNLRSLPGMTYPIGDNFVHVPMDSTSPYAIPWWYRTTFRLPAGSAGRRFVLRFDGINYRANIWLNGRRIADSTQVAGTYRRYDLDVTDALRRAGPNVLALEVRAPTPPDLQTTWVDWNPSPPDKDMGLWKPVYLVSTGDVAIRHPFVVSHVDTATLRSADLTVAAQLRNLAAHPVTGTLRGRIGNVAFGKTVMVPANDSVLVQFTPAEFRQLHFTNPRLWWPAQLGQPELYTLGLTFDVGGRVSDASTTPFGIRQVTSQLTGPRQAYLFRVNGRRVLIRGGGWAPDMFFRPQRERQDAQLQYALHMNLNAVRLEGNYEDDRFFARTDSLGILVMTGWVCCCAWERWKDWGPEQYTVAAASLRDQIRRLRSHPSVFVWLNGSDNPPPADVEKTYLAIEQQEQWPNPVLSSAATRPAEFSGPSGVKMTGPYDWVPPSYWLQDSTHGGAWSYNTETSPGAAVPPIESMRRMIPAADLRWPLDSVWLYHAAGGQFTKLLDRFDTAMAARFGEPKDVEDYTFRSQLITYEGERAMFEAYRRNKYGTTGLIQWMFDNAWPSIYWHLFDWYLRPGGGYFGTRKANEPLHAMYSYDDRSIVVTNAGERAAARVRLRTRILGLDASQKLARDTVLDVPADTSLRIFTLPQPEGVSGAYFLDLRLTDAGGIPLSTNLYWLSTQPDVLSDTSTWYMTPVKTFADYTALRTLPAQPVRVSARFAHTGDAGAARVTVSNPGKGIAFFLRLQVRAGPNGDEVLPVFWDDNYISLQPGETRSLTARYAYRDLHGAQPVLVVSGWNVPRATAR